MSEAQTGSANDASASQNRLVVVADGNTGRGRRLVDACTTAGYPSKLAPHGAAALEIALATQPAAVIARLDLPLVDALKLAEIVRANPRTRDACFIFLGPGEGLGSRGAVGDRLLPGDTRPEEIVSNLSDLLERQGRIESLDAVSERDGAAGGNLADLPLADLLESLLVHRRSGELAISRDADEAGPQTGRILVRDGDVIQAEVGEVDGEKGLFRLLAWSTGAFSFRPGPQDAPPAILAPTRRLLVEGLRQLEEWDRLATRLPPLECPVKLNVKNAELPNIVHPLTQEVLLLLELYSTVRDVVDHCAYPDYQVLRTLHTLAERGILSLGRVPLPTPAEPDAPRTLLGEAQTRRLREWILERGCDEEALPDARLLVVASNPGAIPDFTRLLGRIPGVSLSEAAGRPDIEGKLTSLGRVALDDELGMELVHLPNSPNFEAFWPVAGHGALGTLFLLEGPMGEAVEHIDAISSALGRLPRARTFHVVMLGKGERIAPDELRENLSLIDEASLFLLPLGSEKEPAALMRGLIARVMP